MGGGSIETEKACEMPNHAAKERIGDGIWRLHARDDQRPDEGCTLTNNLANGGSEEVDALDHEHGSGKRKAASSSGRSRITAQLTDRDTRALETAHEKLRCERERVSVIRDEVQPTARRHCFLGQAVDVSAEHVDRDGRETIGRSLHRVGLGWVIFSTRIVDRCLDDCAFVTVGREDVRKRLHAEAAPSRAVLHKRRFVHTDCLGHIREPCAPRRGGVRQERRYEVRWARHKQSWGGTALLLRMAYAHLEDGGEELAPCQYVVAWGCDSFAVTRAQRASAVGEPSGSTRWCRVYVSEYWLIVVNTTTTKHRYQSWFSLHNERYSLPDALDSRPECVVVIYDSRIARRRASRTDEISAA